jgi:hypothetical protein
MLAEMKRLLTEIKRREKCSNGEFWKKDEQNLRAL